jgi:hypothetical protein
VAPIARRNEVYRRLQAVATLRQRDTEDLLRRGFSKLEFTTRGYGALRPLGRACLARLCHNGQPERLAGIPGFYADQGRDGKPFWTIAGLSGLLIPCRDPQGRIRGYRIRPDQPGKGGKYRWLSSAGRPRGTSSGAHCHIARPLLDDLADSAIWITEGEIKADLAAERLGAVVVSIPGVSLWSRALPELAELLPGGGQVVIALDADWAQKPAVHQALWELSLATQALGYQTEVALWEAIHKGLDDLVTANLRPRRTAPAAIPPPAWKGKITARMLARGLAREPAATLTLTAMRTRLAEILRCRLRS